MPRRNAEPFQSSIQPWKKYSGFAYDKLGEFDLAINDYFNVKYELLISLISVRTISDSLDKYVFACITSFKFV